MISSTILKKISFSLNKLINLDPQIEHLLKPLKDKSLCIHIIDLEQNFILTFSKSSLSITSKKEHDSELTIKGKISHLLEMAIKSDIDHPIFHKEVTLYGEVRLAQHLQDLIYRLDIDLEEYVSRFTGDIIANRIGRSARGFRAWAKERRKNFTRHFVEYLQEEKKIVPSKQEFEKLRRDLETVRNNIERENYHKKQDKL